MEWPLLTVALTKPEDIVMARHRARQVASLVGLDASSQTRLAASVSEISRNALAYAGGGRVSFAISRSPPISLLARVLDNGPGIAAEHLDKIYDPFASRCRAACRTVRCSQPPMSAASWRIWEAASNPARSPNCRHRTPN